MKKYVFTLLLLSTMCLSGVEPLDAQRPRPVMDFTSILNGLDISPVDGMLEFNEKAPVFAAFIPPNGNLDVVFRKIGEPIELHSTALDIDEYYGKFVKVRAIGPFDEKKILEPGEYVVTYRCNGVPITRFRVSMSVNEEDPTGSFRLSGPWQRWVQLRTPLTKSKKKQTPQIVCWLRNESGDFNQPETYSFQVRKSDGELVYETEDASVAHPYWKSYVQTLRFPLNIGGNEVTPIEFFNRDGNFTLQIRKGDKLQGIYQFKVVDGRLQFHPRQKTGYVPNHGYLITRFAGEKRDGSRAQNVFWMEQGSVDQANAIAAADTGASNRFITAAQKENWKWKPTSEPNRKFELVLTDVDVNDQSHLALGDDLMVFGTNYPRGVAYINTGDTQKSTIPQGESYDSRLFLVCGKKIVLIKHKSVVVYDTTTGKLTPVDANEVLLYEVKGGLYRSNMIHADGNLVAVVNDLSLIKDQRTIKVIDLGGPKPFVISLRNGNFIPPEISGIAVDAESETVVVASWQRKKIYYSKIEPEANFNELSLADYNGISRKQFQIVDGGLLYCDLDENLRYVKLDETSEPLLLSNDPVGIGGAGFDTGGGRVVMATNKQSGTRFEIAVADFPDTLRVVAGTGNPIVGTTGEYGMAGRATVTEDGTVFLSGTPGGGIGIGEFLQVQHADYPQWQAVVDSTGKPIPAIDVVSGPRLMSFKTGGYNARTKLAYAAFGEKLEISDIPTIGNRPGPKKDSEEDDPTVEMSEADQKLIENYQKVEKDLKKSFSDAIGAKRGAIQARKTILDVIRRDGNERLIDTYEKLTKEK